MVPSRAMQYKRKRDSKWEPTLVRCNFTSFKVHNIENRSNLLPNNLCKNSRMLVKTGESWSVTIKNSVKLTAIPHDEIITDGPAKRSKKDKCLLCLQ